MQSAPRVVGRDGAPRRQDRKATPRERLPGSDTFTAIMSAAAKSRMVIVASKPWATTSTGESPSTNFEFHPGVGGKEAAPDRAITATMAPALDVQPLQSEAGPLAVEFRSA